jgi:hypothetical protein
VAAIHPGEEIDTLQIAVLPGNNPAIRLAMVAFTCFLVCQGQDGVPINWQARLAGIRLYQFSDRPFPSFHLPPPRFHALISWQGVEDRDVAEHYSRVGGGNVPKRLGHVIVASVMSLPANRVVAYQAQPFRPVDRIALRPEQLYYRYRKPWQPGVVSLRNSAKRNLTKEFGPDITSFVRSIRGQLF